MNNLPPLFWLAVAMLFAALISYAFIPDPFPTASGSYTPPDPLRWPVGGL